MRYRYGLSRVWDDEAPALYAGLINPSTADDVDDDSTVRGQMGRARAHGFGGLHVWNPFALRSSTPAAIFEHDDPSR